VARPGHELFLHDCRVFFCACEQRKTTRCYLRRDFGRIYLPWTNNGNYRLYIQTRILSFDDQCICNKSSEDVVVVIVVKVDADVAAAAHYMTTERRKAMEVLLWQRRDTQKAVHSCVSPVAVPKPHVAVPAPEVLLNLPAQMQIVRVLTADQADGDLEEAEGPCASFASTTSPHQMRRSCTRNVLSPLSQDAYGLVATSGTKSARCRVAMMITEDAVWEGSQRLRKTHGCVVRGVICFGRRESDVETNNATTMAPRTFRNTGSDEATL
jgi:hypothetical protein